METLEPRVRCVAWRMTEDEFQRLLPFFGTFDTKTEGIRWLLSTSAVRQLMKMRVEDQT